MRRAAEQEGVPATALVTGAAGFIGCHLIERLVAAGWSIRGIDDERTGDWERVKVPIDRVDASLEKMSAQEFHTACSGVDLLFHLAAEKHNTPGVTADRTVAVNIGATARLFDAAGAAGVSKVLFTSSLYAYGSIGPEPVSEVDIPAPATLYGVSKLAGEHLLRVAAHNHGLSWSVARVFFVYGPRQLAEGGYPSVIVRNFDRIRSGERPVINGDGEQALDYVYIDDCVEALVMLATGDYHGLTVNVASGNAASINRLTESMLAVSGSSLTPVHGPPDWTAGSRRVGSAALAADRLGWTATTGLAEGLRRVWDEQP